MFMTERNRCFKTDILFRNRENDGDSAVLGESALKFQGNFERGAYLQNRFSTKVAHPPFIQMRNPVNANFLFTNRQVDL